MEQDQGFVGKANNNEVPDIMDNTLNVELVGIKNLKTTHNWRLEFDVFEMDSSKVKNLMDKINTALVMVLVENG